MAGMELKKKSGITLRSVIIAIILVPLNYYWIIAGEMEMGGGTYMLPSFHSSIL
jgi:hypothetical protein